MNKPASKPACPNFSSGPCAKHPGYAISKLSGETLGRSHRSAIGKKVLKDAIEKSRALLNIPDDYRLGIVPASDTGAVEMFLWSALGAKPVDVCFWESFGQGWMSDITKELKLADVRQFKAEYGELPDLSQTNPDFNAKNLQAITTHEFPTKTKRPMNSVLSNAKIKHGFNLAINDWHTELEKMINEA